MCVGGVAQVLRSASLHFVSRGDIGNFTILVVDIFKKKNNQKPSSHRFGTLGNFSLGSAGPDGSVPASSNRELWPFIHSASFTPSPDCPVLLPPHSAFQSLNPERRLEVGGSRALQVALLGRRPAPLSCFAYSCFTCHVGLGKCLRNCSAQPVKDNLHFSIKIFVLINVQPCASRLLSWTRSLQTVCAVSTGASSLQVRPTQI